MNMDMNMDKDMNMDIDMNMDMNMNMNMNMNIIHIFVKCGSVDVNRSREVLLFGATDD